MTQPAAVLVIPCYNEAGRLDCEAFGTFARSSGMRLLFVDDGSQDDTAGLLRTIREAAPEQVEVLSLEANAGKAEAVRLGLQQALGSGAILAGYVDADLATPLCEVSRLMEFMLERRAEAALGSRVALMGAEIRRHPARHYLGRVFATAASFVLGVAVYDTQCGAKWFRASPTLAAAVTDPFVSRWAFDVELLGRLLTGDGRTPPIPANSFVEMPLRRWRDVTGSKLGITSMFGALADLMRIRRYLRRRARLAAGSESQ